MALAAGAVLIVGVALAQDAGPPDAGVLATAADPGPYAVGTWYTRHVDAARGDRVVRFRVFVPTAGDAVADGPAPVDTSGAPYPVVVGDGVIGEVSGHQLSPSGLVGGCSYLRIPPRIGVRSSSTGRRRWCLQLGVGRCREVGAKSRQDARSRLVAGGPMLAEPLSGTACRPWTERTTLPRIDHSRQRPWRRRSELRPALWVRRTQRAAPKRTSTVATMDLRKMEGLIVTV